MSGLRARATLAVLTLVAALAALAVVVARRADDALVDAERARFQAATAQLVDAVSYGVLARSPALLQGPLDAFASAPDVVTVEILDDKGERLVAHAGAAASATVEIALPVVTRAAPPGDDGELAAFGVAPSEPRTVGTVRAQFSTAGIVEVQRATRRQILLAVAVAGLIGLIGVALIATSVVRRLRALAVAAERVQRGDLSVRVDDTGADELSALARDFNAMTASLVEQQRKLDEAGKVLAERETLAAIGRANAVIAHELKNPLGIVLGAAQIVGNDKKPLAARAQAAQIVEEEVRRLERTLEGLLSYAKPSEPKRAPVDVLALCQRAAERARLPGGPAEQVAIAVEGDRARALADEGQAQQILLNLLTNAAQAGAKNVRVLVSEGKDRARIVVHDDGPGISAALRDDLFRPFTTTKQRGTGLGLAASRRMARDNGGDLVNEAADLGARFRFELPLEQLK